MALPMLLVAMYFHALQDLATLVRDVREAWRGK